MTTTSRIALQVDIAEVTGGDKVQRAISQSEAMGRRQAQGQARGQQAPSARQRAEGVATGFANIAGGPGGAGGAAARALGVATKALGPFGLAAGAAVGGLVAIGAAGIKAANELGTAQALRNRAASEKLRVAQTRLAANIGNQILPGITDFKTGLANAFDDINDRIFGGAPDTFRPTAALTRQIIRATEAASAAASNLQSSEPATRQATAANVGRGGGALAGQQPDLRNQAANDARIIANARAAWEAGQRPRFVGHLDEQQTADLFDRFDRGESVATLPRRHRGGIVQRRPGGQVIAEGGQDELITPLPQGYKEAIGNLARGGNVDTLQAILQTLRRQSNTATDTAISPPPPPAYRQPPPAADLDKQTIAEAMLAAIKAAVNQGYMPRPGAAEYPPLITPEAPAVEVTVPGELSLQAVSNADYTALTEFDPKVVYWRYTAP